MTVDVATALSGALEEWGWRASYADAAHLEDLRAIFADLRERGTFENGILSGYIDAFAFDPPHSLPRPKSLVVIAMPAHVSRITFRHRGAPFPVLVPPTYVRYGERKRLAAEVAATAAAEHGCRAVLVRVPEKTAAVRTGLARYGRNNVTYVPGFGPAAEIVALLSDLPCADDVWREPEAMERCASCTACARACPAGAIGSDRFLLHHDRCVTLYNENDEPLPPTIRGEMLSAVIGCMACQQACPEAREALAEVDDIGEFGEDETALIARGTPLRELPVETRRRVDELGLPDSYVAWSRNLGMLLEAADGRSS